MRDALSALTVRGRSFLAAGAAAACCALVLGDRDLLRVGVLLMALPLVSVAVVSRTRYKVACSRRLEPARVAAGRESRVVVEMENVSRSPTGLLLVEDRIPYVLGSRPRFVLDRVEPAGRRGVSYRIRSDVRGRFTVGPLTVRLTDPFGLVEMDRAFEATQTLTVTPHVTPLAHTRLGGEWTGAGENLARAVSMAGEDDVAPREYRYGDDLRRVHWRSTARRGELMVRREEQPWQSRCSLLLDCRRGAHRGEGPGSSFEWAVSAAASIGLHLSRQGYAVRLLTDTGTAVSSAAHDPSTVGSDFEGVLLDALAVIRLTGGQSLRPVEEALRRSGGEGLFVAILGHLTEAEADELARLRHGTTAALAILLNTAAWSPRGARGADRTESETHSTAAQILRAAGWRVAMANPGDALGKVWGPDGESRRTEPSWED